MSRSDRVIGILLGVLVGLVVLVLFVFFGSEETIDSPSIDAPTAEQGTSTSDR